MPTAPAFPFFVYVIESPSAPDLYHKRSEAELIRGAVALNGITCTARCAINRIAFAAAFQIGLKDEMQRLPGYLPMIHISTHGGPDGLQLSNDELLRWDELAELLAPINKVLQGRLIVAMSCCEGYSGIQMAMRLDGIDLAFHALVGTPEKPTWAETAVAFSTFYHQIAIGSHIAHAVDAMCAASGRSTFFVQWGEQTRQSFLDYIKRAELEEAPRQLEQKLDQEPPKELTKMEELEKGRPN